MKNGEILLKEDIKNDTIWVNQKEISEIFGVDQSVVSRHIKNVFKDGEVKEKSNMQNMHIANSNKPVKFYNLDIILAVGYRTNSSRATEFRKWATKTLKQHITEGFTINPKRLEKNKDKFLEIINDLQLVSINKGLIKTEDKERIIGLIILLLKK